MEGQYQNLFQSTDCGNCGGCYPPPQPPCPPPQPCNPCQPDCYPRPPQPCPPQWGCGSTYYEWCDRCGNKFRTLLTSSPDLDALKASLAALGAQIQGLYNRVAPVTAAEVIALGLFDNNSSFLTLEAPPPLNAPTAIPYNVTRVGSLEIATAVATLFNGLKTSFPTSTMAVSFPAVQLLGGDLAAIVLQIVVSSNIPGGPTFTFRLAANVRTVNCGKSTPVVVSGTFTTAVSP